MNAFGNVLSAIAAWIVAAISIGGYPGIAALMAVESACIPLPSEVIMPFGGYLASTGRLDLWLVATAGAVGCNVGSAIAYEAGRRGGRRLVERYGGWLLLTPGDLDRADRFFARFGGAAVLVGRLIPGVRSFIALPAGITGMPIVRFHVLTFTGSWIWCFGLALAGKQLGQRWSSDPQLAAMFHRFDLVIATAAALGVAWLAWRRIGSGHR